jgi:hypothetical protein
VGIFSNTFGFEIALESDFIIQEGLESVDSSANPEGTVPF